MIKKIFLFCIIVFAFAFCTNNHTNKATKTDKPIIQFAEQEHNFGIVLEGEKVMYRFKFTNIGKGELIIKNAKASCGCTVPSFNKEPIKMGEEGYIEVVFDSSKRIGTQNKNINVWTNTQEQPILLKIQCDIVKSN